VVRIIALILLALVVISFLLGESGLWDAGWGWHHHRW
jgi:hypothetical protein